MKLKKYFFYVLVWLAICGLAGLIASRVFHLGFWLVFGITAAALLVNGIVAEVEDRMPGGFLNPREKK